MKTSTAFFGNVNYPLGDKGFIFLPNKLENMPKMKKKLMCALEKSQMFLCLSSGDGWSHEKHAAPPWAGEAERPVRVCCPEMNKIHIICYYVFSSSIWNRKSVSQHVARHQAWAFGMTFYSPHYFLNELLKQSSLDFVSTVLWRWIWVRLHVCRQARVRRSYQQREYMGSCHSSGIIFRHNLARTTGVTGRRRQLADRVTPM